MWQRLTDRARQAVSRAQQEAIALNEPMIGTEHLLLGLTHDIDCVAMQALRHMGITPSQIQDEVRGRLSGIIYKAQNLQFTPRLKQAIDLAYEESRRLGCNYIGTEHLLLGLIRENDGIAAKVLKELGAELGPTLVALSDLNRTDTDKHNALTEALTALAPVQHEVMQMLHGLSVKNLPLALQASIEDQRKNPNAEFEPEKSRITAETHDGSTTYTLYLMFKVELKT